MNPKLLSFSLLSLLGMGIPGGLMLARSQSAQPVHDSNHHTHIDSHHSGHLGLQL